MSRKKTDLKKLELYTFTHVWVNGFGWKNAIYQKSDFEIIEDFGFNDEDGYVFLCIQENGKQRLLKGKYNF